MSTQNSDVMIVEPWKYWTQCKWWNNEELRKDNLVPDSCCRTQTPHCGKRDHPSNIYRSGKDKKIFFDVDLLILKKGNKYMVLNYKIFINVGCISRVAKIAKDHLIIVGALAIGICLVQLIGIILACALQCRLRRIYHYG